MKITSIVLATVGSGLLASSASAAISYSVAGSVYQEGFDNLPLAHPGGAAIPSSASLQPTPYSEGWKDDTTSDSAHISVPGWHLYHQTTQTEGGFNGHQRFRYGSGASGTGSFYAFAANSGTAEKALGAVGANTLVADGGSIFIGLQLINDTGVTLNEFTLTYDGEQWRDGGSATVDSLDFAYSLTKTDEGGADPWYQGTGLTAVPQLNFVPPVDTATAAAVNGNVEGKVADISFTVTGINWAPGGELWLRWKDTQLVGADDGVALDNVRFSAVAVPEPGSLALLSLGVLGLARRRRA